MTHMHWTSPLRLTAFLVALSCLVAVGPPAHAGDGDGKQSGDARAEASEHFRRGVKLHKDGDYVAALVEFKRAYELAPNYRVLYNLGQTSRELKDYASALVAYQRYLEEGGDAIGAKRKQEVKAAVEDLIDRVGKLTISTNVEGAEIQIDDEVIGVTPLDAPIVVNIGKRRVVATLAGHAPARRVIEVAGRDELAVELELADLTRDAPKPADPDPTRSPEEEEDLPVAGIVALSVTAACAVATGVLGGLALTASGDHEDALATFPGNRTSINEVNRRKKRLAIATDVMIGVTGAGAIATLVLFLVNPGSDTASDPDESEANDGSVDLSLTPSSNGLWLTGSF